MGLTVRGNTHSAIVSKIGSANVKSQLWLFSAFKVKKYRGHFRVAARDRFQSVETTLYIQMVIVNDNLNMYEHIFVTTLDISFYSCFCLPINVSMKFVAPRNLCKANIASTGSILKNININLK